jgi:hypothetical protein
MPTIDMVYLGYQGFQKGPSSAADDGPIEAWIDRYKKE